MIPASDLHSFVRLFQLPEAAIPYIERLVDPMEVRLVLAAGGDPLTAERAREALSLPSMEAATEALERAFRRGILDREGQEGRHLYLPTDFHTRLEIMAAFEPDWDELPVELRQALDRWMLQQYIARVRPTVELLMAGKPAEETPMDYCVVLPEEADAAIASAETIIAVPCHCRRMSQNCDRSAEPCIQFDRLAEKTLARGYGRRLTVREAEDLLRRADRKGLMHVIDLPSGGGGSTVICNCCADDCYLFRAAEQLGSKGVWPRSRHLAAFDHERCQMCGACVKRCHFGAFHHDGTTVERAGLEVRNVDFDPALCWGCGLCTSVCFPEAITLLSLSEPSGVARHS